MNEDKKEDEIYCPECGKPVKRNAVICVNCGVQIKEIRTTLKQENNRNIHGLRPEAVNKKTIPERLIGELLGFLLIPAIAINAVYLSPNVLYAPVAVLMMFYAFFAKKRYLVLESIFFIWAILVMFVIGGKFYVFGSIIRLVKYTPTVFDTTLPRIMMFALPLISIIGGLFFILRYAAVKVYHKFNIKMVLLNSLLFLIILVSLSAPFFFKFRPAVGNAKEFMIGGYNNSQLFNLGPGNNKNAKLNFDNANQIWSVEINLENKSPKPVAVKTLYLNKNKIDFNSDELLLNNILIDKGFLIIMPDSKGTITINSKEPIFRIYLEEDNGFIGGFDF